MKKNYVLDACALIAAIKQEEGALMVAELYENRAGYLVTADHHEMDELDQSRVVNFLWIR